MGFFRVVGGIILAVAGDRAGRGHLPDRLSRRAGRRRWLRRSSSGRATAGAPGWGFGGGLVGICSGTIFVVVLHLHRDPPRDLRRRAPTRVGARGPARRLGSTAAGVPQVRTTTVGSVRGRTGRARPTTSGTGARPPAAASAPRETRDPAGLGRDVARRLRPDPPARPTMARDGIAVPGLRRVHDRPPRPTMRTPMKTILVVDDEPKIVQLARDYLEHAGFAVVTAGDGRAALDTIATAPPDLVVLDLGLPEVDGLEVTRRLRREGEIPIVMLTARDDELDKLLGLELGADDYITKPFSPRELVARVRAVLRRTDAAAEPTAGLRRREPAPISSSAPATSRSTSSGCGSTPPDGTSSSTPTEFQLLVALGAPARSDPHPFPAPRRRPRRRLRVVRAGDRHPRQEPPPQARAGPAACRATSSPSTASATASRMTGMRDGRGWRMPPPRRRPPWWPENEAWPPSRRRRADRRGRAAAWDVADVRLPRRRNRDPAAARRLDHRPQRALDRGRHRRPRRRPTSQPILAARLPRPRPRRRRPQPRLPAPHGPARAARGGRPARGGRARTTPGCPCRSAGRASCASCRGPSTP